MKKYHFSQFFLKYSLITGVLLGCQNDQIPTPVASESITEINQHAKISAEVLLVKDGDYSLEYIPSGKFAGKLAKVSNIYNYTDYSYNDSTGDLWITSKKYSKASNKLVHQKTYHIVNGRCVSGKDLTQQFSFTFQYNVLGSLVEMKRVAGVHTLTRQFSYKFIAPNKQRLDKITDIGESGPYIEYRFTYSSTPDKYPLNPKYTEHEMDKYLNIFGTFSDMLVQNVVSDELEGPDGFIASNNYTYTLNADGYVTSKTNLYYPDINHSNYSEVLTEVLDYANTWPGL